jgi:DNA-binding beta-propeller fold protein YncE
MSTIKRSPASIVRNAWLCVTALFMAACGSAPSVTPGAVQQPAMIQHVRTNMARPDLIYVGNYGQGQPSVTFYSTLKNRLLGTISGGMDDPYPFISPTGELYVANYYGMSVEVYSAGSHKLERTLTREIRFPFQVIFDSTGDAYVLTRPKKIVFFPNGQERGLHTIKGKYYAIALDSKDNLYATGDSAIDVYKPGANTPFQTITNGVHNAFDIALDTAGNLYAANYDRGPNCGSVTVYTPAGELAYKITQGICKPSKVAIGNEENLYVLNNGGSGYSVTVYALGQSTLLRTITQGLDAPALIVTDDKSNLYVANYSNITVYASGSNALLRTITAGVDVPDGLGTGPQ